MHTTLIILTQLYIVFAVADSSCYNQSNWMKTFRPYIVDKPLNSIFIPGSHDSATVGFPLGAGCQASNIITQFNTGARYFDLRYCGLPGGIGICHGPAMPPVGATYRWINAALYHISVVASLHPDEIIVLKLQENDVNRLSNYNDLYGLVQRYIGPYVINSTLVPVNSTYGEIKAKTNQSIYVVFESPGCKNAAKPICQLSSSTGFNDAAYLASKFAYYSSETVPALLKLTQEHNSPNNLIVTQFVNYNPDPKDWVTITNAHANVMIGALFGNNIADIILLNFMTTSDNAAGGAAYGCTATNKIIIANMLPGGSYRKTCTIVDLSPIGLNFTASCVDKNGQFQKAVYPFPPPGTNSCENKDGSITCQ